MRDPAFLFYSKDFYEATRTMLPKERACYIDLLIYQHQNEYIPNEIERISMYCSGIDEATLQATLQAKFKLCDKGWYNERLSSVIEQRKAFSDKQSDNGLIGQFFKKAKSSLPSKDYTKLKEFIYFTYTKEKLINDLKINNNHEAMLQAMLKHLVNVNVNKDLIKSITKEEEEKENNFDFRKSLFELVQDEQLVNDFLIVRKNKKSSNTETAFNGLIKKITQANISVKDAIKICVEKSWAGFDGEWLAKSGITVPSSSNEKQIEFYEGKQIYESNGRRYILKGESVKYIYPKEPNMEGWTEKEIYNYRTCDRFNDTWAEKYKNARDNQMNTTEAEKRGIYKYFYDQETLRFKIADHRNVRTS